MTSNMGKLLFAGQLRACGRACLHACVQLQLELELELEPGRPNLCTFAIGKSTDWLRAFLNLGYSEQ